MVEFRAKLRFACEPFQKKGTTLDESIASFLSRRIGRKTTEKLVDPVLGGIYAGDINYLSANTVLENLKRRARKRFVVQNFIKSPPKVRKIINLKGFAISGSF